MTAEEIYQKEYCNDFFAYFYYLDTGEFVVDNKSLTNLKRIIEANDSVDLLAEHFSGYSTKTFGEDKIQFTTEFFTQKFNQITSQLTNKSILNSFNNYLRIIIFFYEYSSIFKHWVHEATIKTILSVVDGLVSSNSDQQESILLCFSVLHKHSLKHTQIIFEQCNAQRIIECFLNKLPLKWSTAAMTPFPLAPVTLAVSYISNLTCFYCFTQVIGDRLFKILEFIIDNLLNGFQKDSKCKRVLESDTMFVFYHIVDGVNCNTNLYLYEFLTFLVNGCKNNDRFKRIVAKSCLCINLIEMFGELNLQEKQLSVNILGMSEMNKLSRLHKIPEDKFTKFKKFKFSKNGDDPLDLIKLQFIEKIAEKETVMADTNFVVPNLDNLAHVDLVIFLNKKFTESEWLLVFREMVLRFNNPIQQNVLKFTQFLLNINLRHGFHEPIVEMMITERFFNFVSNVFETLFDEVTFKTIDKSSELYEFLYHFLRLLVVYSNVSEAFVVNLSPLFQFRVKLGVLLFSTSFNDEFVVKCLISILYNLTEISEIAESFHVNQFTVFLLQQIDKFSKLNCRTAVVVIVGRMMIKYRFANDYRQLIFQCGELLMQTIIEAFEENERCVYKNSSIVVLDKPFSKNCSLIHLLELFSSFYQKNYNEISVKANFFNTLDYIYTADYATDQEKVAVAHVIFTLMMSIENASRLITNKKFYLLLESDSKSSKHKLLRATTAKIFTHLNNFVRVSAVSNYSDDDVKMSVEACTT